MLHSKPHRTLSQAPMPNDRTLRPDQRRSACGRIGCPGAVWHGTLCRGERLSATNMILGREFRGRLVRMRATNRLQSEWGGRHCTGRKGRRSRPARPANSVRGCWRRSLTRILRQPRPVGHVGRRCRHRHTFRPQAGESGGGGGGGGGGSRSYYGWGRRSRVL